MENEFIDRLVSIAKNEVGYLEKKTASNLDSKTENVGDKNYTKYARDMANEKYFNGSKQGYAWCAVFVSWCFCKAFGKDNALKLQCQPTKDNCGAGCASATNYYKKKSQFYSTPQVGDQIFFYTGGTTNIGHTGLVVGVDNTYVYTIEGNTSGGNEVIPNGGAVCEKKYALSNTKIVGYGRPDFEGILNGTVLPEEQKKEELVNMKEGTIIAASGKTVNLRMEPATTAKILTLTKVGETIHYEDYNADWVKIDYNGVIGYMMKKFVKENVSDDECVSIKLPKQLAIALKAAIEATGV